MKNKVEIYFPIVSDYHFEEYPFEQRKIVINEIKKIVRNGPQELSNYVNLVSINAKIEEYNQELIRHKLLQPFWGLEEDLLGFEFIVEIDLNSFKVTSHMGDEVTEIKEESELIEFVPSALADEFGYWLYEILVLSQIVRPGSLKLRAGKAYVNDAKILNLPKVLHTREQIELQKERAYPEIQYLDFEPFYNWILKNNLLFSMNPTNSYQKAINNLSYVGSVEDEIGRFVYQMRILEEIYTDSIHQIAEQLNEKIQLFLGEMETFKKQIKNMYNVRSCFMHGASIIVPFHKVDYIEHDYDKSYDKEVHKAISFSLLLIISTLQKMYLNNYLEINYELKITGHNKG